MLLYNTSKVNILFERENKYIEQCVKGFLSSEELKEFQTILLSHCEKMKVKKILSDTAELKVVKNDDISWMIDNVKPQLIKCGIQYFAIVLPQNIFGQAAVKLFSQKDNLMEIKLFNDKDNAVEWLISIN